MPWSSRNTLRLLDCLWLGLGKGAVQAVLKRHGITRVPAGEGGRASRGPKASDADLVERYNEAAGEFETDPSLKIELRR